VKRAGSGCGNHATTARSRISGNIASLHSSPGFFNGTVNMKSFVVIYLLRGERARDIEAALRKQIDLEDAVEKPTAAPARTIEDADQLPLWRWFISSE
jgi:hypothetical protein